MPWPAWVPLALVLEGVTFLAGWIGHAALAARRTRQLRDEVFGGGPASHRRE